MMEEEDFVPYKDISALKKDLDGLKGKKDVSPKEMYDAVGKLAQAIEDMLEIFGAAAEQMRLEDKGIEAESKKHEMIISKLDKILDQNKTIAEGMVAVVEMVKEKIVEPAKEKDESMFKPDEVKELPLFRPAQEKEDVFFKPQTGQFMKPAPNWQPRPEPMMRRPQSPAPQPTMMPQPMAMPPMQPSQLPPPPMGSSADFGMDLPPLEPTPSQDLDFPALDLPEGPFGLEGEPKKKGLFGMFKK